MTYKDRLELKLRDAFAPRELIVRDDSHHHAGHSGARPEGETHFHVTIRADHFKGMSRVARQRAVYKAVDAELKEWVHALALDVSD